ncbi:hypothetical protein MKK67_07995 [Methylobacterium sp. J-072]|uniref:hypothetical protein n=1 Tax=Methylobacterium sp. J-072 TaxID=2836651 RepID=UPI001FBAC0CE|nr:hypothetical protein [Methylobacterium sp. J-072]MCJ2092437.1 hypothetical protein [Methylobacterium sp. J-072]
MSINEPKDSSYYKLIPLEWLSDATIVGAVVRGYSSGIAEFPDLYEPAIAAVKSLIVPLGGKFAMCFRAIAKQEPQLIFEEVVTFHGEEIKTNLNVRQGVVPAGHYAFLILPICNENEDYIRRRADSIRGLLTLVAGHTAMLDLVFEQRFDLSKPDQISRVSKVVENHVHPNTWRIFSTDTLQAAKEAFENCPTEIRSRAELAFGFIARSTNVIDQSSRYANIWIALEIAAGGNSALKKFLNSLDPAFAKEAKRFIDTRNNLFHEGRHPTVNQTDERFLCACVVALILRQIGITDPAFNDLVKERLISRAAYE